MKYYYILLRVYLISLMLYWLWAYNPGYIKKKKKTLRELLLITDILITLLYEANLMKHFTLKT